MANPTTFDAGRRPATGADRDSGGPTRIASRAVSGIGFLGGVIPYEGGGARGTGRGVSATGPRVRRDSGGPTALRATVRPAGDPACGLKRLVARTALESGVRDLRRDPDDGPLGTERKAVAA
ncbi:hypothetical protein ACFC08_02355 [Streptomyces sp. NPDC056112]|uniref:hypothetical protein n=1 Tax=unclassified Streptomyces TaxID=2593676 RepID=UPI0024810409|nr:hypothetical protein [Streptomyces sp. HYC2]